MKKQYVHPSLVACSVSTEDVLTGSPMSAVNVEEELGNIKSKKDWNELGNIS